jgi:N-methylhydantoinase B
MNQWDPISVVIFENLFSSVAEEMGVTLCRTAFSPNIKERRDYSCACFLADGRMIAQAAHIPVHLGAMPASVRAVLDRFENWSPGDLVVLNDPFLGGTHLPDITMVSPVFADNADEPAFFVASRAHHADVGGSSPGSLPLATEIYQEGLIIPPVRLIDAGRSNDALLDVILRNVRTRRERRGDLSAQVAANRVGEQRLRELVARYGYRETLIQAHSLLTYSERLMRNTISRIPDGSYSFVDEMDDDGLDSTHGASPIAGSPGSVHQKEANSGLCGPQVRAEITVEGERMIVDFAGSSDAVEGPLNAVRAITESAVWYVLTCLAGPEMPVNSGAFEPIQVIIAKGSILDAGEPHAVGGGNVETSQRIVDTLLGALAQALPDLIPAASQGTMNNVALGGHDPERNAPFAYYETIGGGSGAGPASNGLSGVHVHMTNTLNTPVEALEYTYPIRVLRYALRRQSGGRGQFCGGDGLVREIEVLCSATLTLLTERRRVPPYGLRGGACGTLGRNELQHEGHKHRLPGKACIRLEAGDVLNISTPGGGGWGTPHR